MIQHSIERLLQRLVEEGGERGLQVAVYHEGKLVVDAWAGIADHRTGRAVNGETLFPVFSVSKGITATLIHRLLERGLLGYDTRIAEEVWPEVAANGKESITLRQGLDHTAGLHPMPGGIGISDLPDWKTICSAIANLTPACEHGTRADYHAVTYGWIVGEPACRVSGESIFELLRKEIKEPLGIEAMYFGIPDEVEGRVALLEEYDEEFVPPHDAQPQAIPGWMQPLYAIMNRPEIRRASMPAVSGIMSARAIARHYATLLPGGEDWVELLPQTRLRTATEWQKLEAPGTGYPAVWYADIRGLPGLLRTYCTYFSFTAALSQSSPENSPLSKKVAILAA